MIELQIQNKFDMQGSFKLVIRSFSPCYGHGSGLSNQKILQSLWKKYSQNSVKVLWISTIYVSI